MPTEGGAEAKAARLFIVHNRKGPEPSGAQPRLSGCKGKRRPSVMLQKFASTAFVIGTLLTASIPAVGLAQNHGGRSGGGRNSPSRGSAGSNRGQSFAGGGRAYAPPGSSGGGPYRAGPAVAVPP